MENAEPVETGEKNGLTKLRVVIAIADFVAVFFWTYSLIHIFIFDVDGWLLSADFSILSFLVSYKFFIFSGLVAVLFLITHNRWSLPLLAYVILFPFVIVFWKLPRLLWKAKSPLVTLAFINVVLSFFKSIRYNLACSGFLLVFAGISVISTNYYAVIISIGALLCLLFVTYCNRIRMIMMPSALYEMHSKIIGSAAKHAMTTYKSPFQLKVSIGELDPTDKAKWVESIQIPIISNRAAFFLSRKLRQYQDSNVKIIFYLVHLLVLLLLTTFVFALVNFGLWRVMPEGFQVSDGRFFMFVYYSFSNIFTRGISEIVAIGDFARLLSMAQVLFSFILVGLLVTLLFSVKSEKDEKGIVRAIADIDAEGTTLDDYIQSEFQMTREQAIVELDKAKSAFIRLILYLGDRQ